MSWRISEIGQGTTALSGLARRSGHSCLRALRQLSVRSRLFHRHADLRGSSGRRTNYPLSSFSQARTSGAKASSAEIGRCSVLALHRLLKIISGGYSSAQADISHMPGPSADFCRIVTADKCARKTGSPTTTRETLYRQRSLGHRIGTYAAMRWNASGWRFRVGDDLSGMSGILKGYRTPRTPADTNGARGSDGRRPRSPIRLEGGNRWKVRDGGGVGLW